MFMPIMDNGMNAQYYQQQDHHQLQQFSIASPTPVNLEQQFPSHMYPNSSSNISSSLKRGRLFSEESSSSLPSSTCDTSTQPVIQMTNCDESSSQVPISATPKKARSNNYQVPHSVKPSLLTAMGTLAGGSSNKHGIQGSLAASVPIRRRLSGGHLDQYVGEQGKTFDTDPNRPRSMSF